MKPILLALALMFGASLATADPALSSAEPVIKPTLTERILLLQAGPELSQTCCKRCNKGKACGNSCISKSYTCHKGQGCACN